MRQRAFRGAVEPVSSCLTFGSYSYAIIWISNDRAGDVFHSPRSPAPIIYRISSRLAMAVVHVLLVELGALPQAARAGTASSMTASAALHVRRRDVNPLRMYSLVVRAGMHKAQPTVPAVRSKETEGRTARLPGSPRGLGPGDSFTSTLACVGRVDPDIVTVTNGSVWRQPHLETADAVFSTAEAPGAPSDRGALAEPSSLVSGSSTSPYVYAVFAECPSRPLASQSSTACLTVYVAMVCNPSRSSSRRATSFAFTSALLWPRTLRLICFPVGRRP